MRLLQPKESKLSPSPPPGPTFPLFASTGPRGTPLWSYAPGPWDPQEPGGHSSEGKSGTRGPEPWASRGFPRKPQPERKEGSGLHRRRLPGGHHAPSNGRGAVCGRAQETLPQLFCPRGMGQPKRAPRGRGSVPGDTRLYGPGRGRRQPLHPWIGFARRIGNHLNCGGPLGRCYFLFVPTRAPAAFWLLKSANDVGQATCNAHQASLCRFAEAWRLSPRCAKCCGVELRVIAEQAGSFPTLSSYSFFFRIGRLSAGLRGV